MWLSPSDEHIHVDHLSRHRWIEQLTYTTMLRRLQECLDVVIPLMWVLAPQRAAASEEASD